MTLDTNYLLRCLKTLETTLEALRSSKAGDVQYDVYRLAAVKGFGLSLEVSGRLLRRTLKEYMGDPKAVDTLFYKDVFRQAAKYGILGNEEVERWFEYRDNRNNTAHDYGEEFANETLALISGFLVDAHSLNRALTRSGKSNQKF